MKFKKGIFGICLAFAMLTVALPARSEVHAQDELLVSSEGRSFELVEEIRFYVADHVFGDNELLDEAIARAAVFVDMKVFTDGRCLVMEYWADTSLLLRSGCSGMQHEGPVLSNGSSSWIKHSGGGSTINYGVWCINVTLSRYHCISCGVAAEEVSTSAFKCYGC